MFDRGPFVAHLVHDRLERRIIDHHLVFGVIDDVFELVFEQARIAGVQHAAHPRDAEPADQVARVVHGEAGDLVALAEAQRLQRLAHLLRITAHARPVGAGLAAIRPAGDDFTVRGFPGCVIDHMRDPHAPVLHRAKRHMYSSPFWSLRGAEGGAAIQLHTSQIGATAGNGLLRLRLAMTLFSSDEAQVCLPPSRG